MATMRPARSIVADAIRTFWDNDIADEGVLFDEAQAVVEALNRAGYEIRQKVPAPQ